MNVHLPGRAGRPTRWAITLLATAGTVAVTLAGCSGGAGSSSAGVNIERPGNGIASNNGGPKSAPERPSAVAKPGEVDLTAEQQKLARQAQIALKVRDIGQAAGAVRSTSTAAHGLVLSENVGGSSGGVKPPTNSDITAQTYAEITISVPTDKLDHVLDDLSRLGTVIQRETSTQDVTGSYIDTQSRLKTMQASVDRVRALMARTTDIGQVVSLESQLSQREADLESLQSQMAQLKDSVERSPISVSLTTDAAVVETSSHSGFLGGLSAGWHAFTTSAVVLLTVVGAVLPFAVLVVLLGLPVFWWLRRRHPQRPATDPAPAPQS